MNSSLESIFVKYIKSSYNWKITNICLRNFLTLLKKWHKILEFSKMVRMSRFGCPAPSFDQKSAHFSNFNNFPPPGELGQGPNTRRQT